MQPRDSFVFYKSFYEAIKKQPKTTQYNIMMSILQYEFEEKTIENNLKQPMVDLENDIVAQSLFALIRPQLDANNTRYANSKKGGAPKGNSNAKKQPKQPTVDFLKQQKQPNENVNVNENVNDNENVNVNVNVSPNGDNNTDESNASSSQKKEAVKHHFGNYNHVLLTDKELESLKRDYSNWQELIDYLDEHIERKGYKAKSHYLCIRKWVADAVREEKIRKQRLQQQVSSNNIFYEIGKEEGIF